MTQVQLKPIENGATEISSTVAAVFFAQLHTVADADLKARRVKARAVGVFVAKLVHHLALPPVVDARGTQEARGRPRSIL